MHKQVFVINGSGGVGKDTFVNFISSIVKTINYSSVDKVKEIAREIGWDGGKDERDRKFLSDLKLLTSDYNDMPFQSMKKVYDNFMDNIECDAGLLFLHIREPEEIARAVEEFNAKTILITNKSVKPITTNMADNGVLNYDYDYVINNDGTLDELFQKAIDFTIEVCRKEMNNNE